MKEFSELWDETSESQFDCDWDELGEDGRKQAIRFAELAVKEYASLICFNDLLEALKAIHDFPVDENSEPDVMADALNQIFAIANHAIAKVTKKD